MSSINEISIPAEKTFIPGNLGDLQVKYRDLTFFVTNKDKQEFEIQAGDVSKELRSLSPELLSQCLKTSYLALSKIGDDYSITLQHILKGGGWVSGMIANGVSKVVGAVITGCAAGAMAFATVTLAPLPLIGPAAIIGGGTSTVVIAVGGTRLTDTASKTIGNFFDSVSFLP